MKYLVLLLKKSEILSALAIRLVFLTGKAKEPIHPKHLIKREKTWFSSYLKKNDKIIDLGCGSGSDIIRSAKLVKDAFALDIDKKSLGIARNLARKANIGNLKFYHQDVNKKLPFLKNTFDKVICSDVLEHLKRRNKTLDEIKRILINKGLLFLVVDNPNSNWKKIQKKYGIFYYADPDHYYEYPKSEIINLLKSKRFKIVTVRPVTYDTPFKGFIDLTGGISLSLYKYFSTWKQLMLKKNPHDATGYKIVAQIYK